MRYSKGLKFTSNGDGTCYVARIGKCRSKNIVIAPVSPAGEMVVGIGKEAFSGCYSLTSVSIPNSVESIGEGAFFDCISLTSVAFGENSQLMSIGGFAFPGCTSLTSITIPNSVTNIGSSAFSSCISLIGTSGNYKAFIPETGKIYAQQGPTEYHIGEKLECSGKLIPCKNGLHYCTNMFDIFNYYNGEYGKDFVIAECEVSEENVGHNGDSKRCARWIKPIKLLTRQEVIDIMNGD